MRKKRIKYGVVSLVALFGTVLPILPIATPTALAATVPPVTDSWYVSSNWVNNFPSSTHTSFYNFGYDMAQSYPSGVVVLDWGALVDNSGTYELDTYAYGPLPFSTVQADVEQIIQGWEANPSNQNKVITLVIGTNSSGSSYSTTTQTNMGAAFGNMITALDNYTNNTLPIAGGDDIETQTGWQTPSYPLAFSQGYANAAPPADLYNYGWVDGNIDPTTGNNDTLTNGWTPTDVYEASWGNYNVPAYEVYDSGWAAQYENFDLWSYLHEGSAWTDWPLNMAGVGFLSPDTSYNDMQNALNSNTNTATTILNLTNMQQN